MGYTLPMPDCNDTRQCFASGVIHGGFRVCRILTQTYTQDGQCPFCKKRKEDVACSPRETLEQLFPWQ